MLSNKAMGVYCRAKQRWVCIAEKYSDGCVLLRSARIAAPLTAASTTKEPEPKTGERAARLCTGNFRHKLCDAHFATTSAVLASQVSKLPENKFDAAYTFMHCISSIDSSTLSSSCNSSSTRVCCGCYRSAGLCSHFWGVWELRLCA